MVSKLRSVMWLWPFMWLYQHVAVADNYALEYRLDLTEAPGPAQVTLVVRQQHGQLRRLRFSATSEQFTDFSSHRGLTRDGDAYLWHVPSEGGVLSWQAPITHRRKEGAYDAQLNEHWALFRGEDAFPPMTSVATKGASSEATLIVDLPDDWAFQSALPKKDDGYSINNPDRRFDRPTGWMIAGDIGVRHDKIGGVSVAIAAPKDNQVRRQDLLALLNWTLPELVRVLPSFPAKVLVVSANHPFWRGGLSGPSSLYIHADRPLISENGTSTLVHELFHVGFSRSAVSGSDWIVEGLAEYYSVALLRRSGTVTKSRHEKTLRSLAQWSEQSDALSVEQSSGATTAKAVILFDALDREIRTATDNKKNLDHVVRLLAVKPGRLSTQELIDTVRGVIGAPSQVLSRTAP